MNVNHKPYLSELDKAIKEVEWCLNNEQADWSVWRDEFKIVIDAAKVAKREPNTPKPE